MAITSADQPISRKSLAWLLVAQVFIIAPHFFYVPLWISLVWLIVAFWRWQIFQGAWNYPNKINKTFFVAICCVGLITSMGANVGFKVMISLLLVGFILKLLELKSRKDFVLLVFIAFFILATQFIEFNHFTGALYGFFCLILLCVLLNQLYRETESTGLWRELRTSFFIVLQAIPFMILLFVVVPRLGSFWAVPSPQHAKTGLSDSMSPGDFSKLMESNELAFRVTFSGDIPSHNKLYWRSLVFSSFDGRRWSQSPRQLSRRYASQSSTLLRKNIQYLGDKISYEVIVEPSNQQWLFLLGAAETWTPQIMFTRDMRLQSVSPIAQRMSYSVTAALSYQLNELDADEIAENLRLPLDGNANTRERAKEWLAESGSPEKLIEKIFDYYHKSFFYTLQPPPLGRDSVDEFLWTTRQGFCEHFASSFVFFMRAAGIPARVVTGYQGGDLNEIEHYLSVRQRDAHAWAEVWLDGRGWVMFDPTAAVAPERVQKGIEDSLSATDQALLAKPFGSSSRLFLRITQQWDALNYQWTRWVMSYDSDLQAELLKKWMGELSPLRLTLWVLGVGGLLLMALMLLLIGKKKQPMSESQRIYSQLCKRLAVTGMSPQSGETPQRFFKRVIAARPDIADSLGHIAHLFELWIYADNEQLRSKLNKEVAKFRVKAR